MGRVEARWSGKGPSAIGKTAVDGPCALTDLGFTQDAQADLEAHGGLDKAIHYYPADHYRAWIDDGAMPAGTVPCAFGENMSAFGLTEDAVCIGDIFDCGNTRVQISQGRQPCWKVSEHTGNPRMAYLFQKTGRTGWYFRVLQSGEVSIGDPVRLIDRLYPDLTVRNVTAARLTKKISPSDAGDLAALPELAEDWRTFFAKLA